MSKSSSEEKVSEVFSDVCPLSVVPEQGPEQLRLADWDIPGSVATSDSWSISPVSCGNVPDGSVNRQISAFAWQCCSKDLLLSVKRLDRCDRHQILHSMGELPVESDQRVGVELGQCHVLGVKGVRPPEQAGGLPCDVLKDPVSERGVRGR